MIKNCAGCKSFIPIIGTDLGTCTNQHTNTRLLEVMTPTEVKKPGYVQEQVEKNVHIVLNKEFANCVNWEN